MSLLPRLSLETADRPFRADAGLQLCQRSLPIVALCESGPIVSCKSGSVDARQH